VKLSNVFAQINRDLEESYENGDLLDWVNRCSDDLSPIALLQASQNYTIATTEDAFTFPTTRMKDVAMKVTDSESEVSFYRSVSVTDTQPKGYIAWGNTFTLQHGPTGGTITLYYNKRISQMTISQLEEEMEIDSEFHDLYILYGRAQIQFTEEDQKGNSDRVDSMDMYLARKREFERHIRIKQATAETIEVV
jgi:hypothetical protein